MNVKSMLVLVFFVPFYYFGEEFSQHRFVQKGSMRDSSHGKKKGAIAVNVLPEKLTGSRLYHSMACKVLLSTYNLKQLCFSFVIEKTFLPILHHRFIVLIVAFCFCRSILRF